jgi:hypothetical protein
MGGCPVLAMREVGFTLERGRGQRTAMEDMPERPVGKGLGFLVRPVEGLVQGAAFAVLQ